MDSKTLSAARRSARSILELDPIVCGAGIIDWPDFSRTIRVRRIASTFDFETTIVSVAQSLLCSYFVETACFSGLRYLNADDLRFNIILSVVDIPRESLG